MKLMVRAGRRGDSAFGGDNEGIEESEAAEAGAQQDNGRGSLQVA